MVTVLTQGVYKVFYVVHDNGYGLGEHYFLGKMKPFNINNSFVIKEYIHFYDEGKRYSRIFFPNDSIIEVGERGEIKKIRRGVF